MESPAVDKEKVLRRLGRISAVAISGSALVILLRRWHSSRKKQKDIALVEADKARTSQHPELNKHFLKELMSLLKLCFPGLVSKEVFLFLCHTASLFTRTFLSIYVAQVDGYLVKAIVERNLRRFVWNLVRFMMVALPATFINSLIRFLESKLALAFRTQLVQHAYKLYFSEDVYYKVGNLDNRLANADHSMTEDIRNFSESVAHIYSHISKPILDLFMMPAAFVVMTKKAHSNTGLVPVMLAISVTSLTGVILKLVSPQFGKLVADEARHYGYLRYVHSRIIANSEEIAFYQGDRVSCCSYNGNGSFT